MMLNMMKFVPDLEMKYEFSKLQAEGMIKTIGDVMDHFITKSDLREHDLATRNDFNQVRSDIAIIFKDLKSMEEGIRKDMSMMGDKITIRLSGAMVVLFGSLLAAQKLLFY